MENFKSFGRKLTVPFFPGFTAITGPNGSGKSNIADAILFVLGPRSSKTMRAGRLTDLIFNGGKKRKNPSNFCKVSLVFENHERKMPVDSNEVTLTKMIKRAPLKDNQDNYYSYYYINGKASNCTEFTSILQQAQTSGDGYNIVQQGDVTNIIEMGGVERRKLLDEIAGISTFDEDIQKAEKEKEEVDTNLERIKIIVKEIDNQLKQLKNERDEAARYNELRHKLYEIKSKIVVKKKQEILTQLSSVTNQIKTYENEQSLLSEKANTFKHQIKTKQEELKKIEQKIAEVGGDEVKEIKDQIDSLREDEIKTIERINYDNEEIKESNGELQTYQKRIHEIDHELEILQKENEKLNNEINEIQIRIEEKDSSLQELKQRIASTDDNSMDLTKSLLELKKKYDDSNSKLHEEKLSHQRVSDQIESLEKKIAELEETRETYEFEIKDIDWQIEEQNKQQLSINKQKKKYETELFQTKKHEAELSEQLQDLDRRIRRLIQEKAKLQAEHDAYSTIQNQYNRAVTEVLKARDSNQLSGVHGTIAELAHVEDQYKKAMGIAAGSRLQSIIVDDDDKASKAIKFLQQKKLGRATFLPLNKMISGKPRGKALMVINDSSSIGFAIDLVKFKDEYCGAFWYVFGDTIVVDTLENARRLMGGVRLVDLDGSLIEASGAMHGGSSPKTNLMFGDADRTRLEQVNTQLKESMRAQEQIEKELSLLKKTISELEEKLASFKVEDPNQPNIQQLRSHRKEYTLKLENITKLLGEKINEKETVLSNLNKLNQIISSIEDELKTITQEKHNISNQLIQGSNKQDAQESRQLNESIEKLRKEFTERSSEQQGCVKKIEVLNQRKSELDEHVESISKTILEHKSEIESLKKQRDEYQDKIKTLSHVQEKMSDNIESFSTKRDSVQKILTTTEHDLDKINTKIESYYDLISRAQYRLPTLEDTIKELDEELKLYGVIVDDESLPPVESLKDSQRVIEETMHELEPVNMRALEEYTHQQQRKEKLDDDVRHLKNQRKNLIKLVDEITKKKTDRFSVVFKEINKNFQLMYARLSEGGEAELQLENPDDIFSSGLTIKARPRGKKVLLLSALSGGEKSIASLAFIFAIQQYDPSPFYVLDEIDMFLDGVNAELVSRMIKQNALDTQFIIVSLRKIALKEANHVYGVTMQDDGISNMIGNIDPDVVGPEGQIKVMVKT
jgi:chromosome segregation protein